jgi:hypothetical protein
MQHRIIVLFCSVVWIGTRTCLWLACLLSTSVIATFAGALRLLPHTILSTDHSHHSTGRIAPTEVHGHRPSTSATMGDATEPNRSSQDSPFLALAEELVLSITSHISRGDLCALALVSKKCHRFATPLIWKNVELTDCRANTDATTGHRFVTYGPATATHRGRNIPAGTQLSSDEHDDTPLIKILLVLAT